MPFSHKSFEQSAPATRLRFNMDGPKAAQVSASSSRGGCAPAGARFMPTTSS
jgi:hypothetical protein